jgi:hypothetical protein
VNKKLPVSSLYYHTSLEEDNPVPKSRGLRSVKMSQLPAEMSAILQFGEETSWHNRCTQLIYLKLRIC